MHKIVFNPVISPAAWEIGMSLLPKGFTIELLEPDPDQRVKQLVDRLVRAGQYPPPQACVYCVPCP